VVGVPPHEAQRLLAVATGRSRHELLVGGEVSSAEEQRYQDLVKQRLAGVPLQHLEGSVQFGPIEIRSDDRALVPRPETEHLWEEAVTALKEAGPGTVIVDLCTGSGNLALALKHTFPSAQKARRAPTTCTAMNMRLSTSTLERRASGV